MFANQSLLLCVFLQYALGNDESDVIPGDAYLLETVLHASQAVGHELEPRIVDRMLKDASRRKFDVVMAWAIDRMGRSLRDLVDTLDHLNATGVDLYLDQQNIDTTVPAGRLLFQVTGAFAEFERSMIRQRVYAELTRARTLGKRLGRPSIDPETEQAIRDAQAGGAGIIKVARKVGVGNGTVSRVKAAMSTV
jgi:DNA invertase Pin-like site-specific DNA recombinase